MKIQLTPREIEAVLNFGLTPEDLLTADGRYGALVTLWQAEAVSADTQSVAALRRAIGKSRRLAVAQKRAMTTGKGNTA